MKGIVEIIGDVVKEMSGNLTIVMPADIENDRFEEVKNPELNYIFGSAQYVKDKLDEYSKVPSTSERKFCYREERQSGLLFKGFTEYPYSVFINEELEQ